MTTRHLIARGIGFDPGSVKFVVTHGFGAGAAVVPVPPAAGGDDAPARRADVQARSKQRRAFEAARDRQRREIRKSLEDVHRFITKGPRVPAGRLEDVSPALARAAEVEATIAEFFDKPTATFDIDALLASAEGLERLQTGLRAFERARRAEDEEEAMAILLLLS